MFSLELRFDCAQKGDQKLQKATDKNSVRLRQRFPPNIKFRIAFTQLSRRKPMPKPLTPGKTTSVAPSNEQHTQDTALIESKPFKHHLEQACSRPWTSNWNCSADKKRMRIAGGFINGQQVLQLIAKAMQCFNSENFIINQELDIEPATNLSKPPELLSR